MYGNYMQNCSVTIANVTNVVKSASVSGFPGRGPFRGRPRRRVHGEMNIGPSKDPKLLRFYQTCGMRDADKASAMSEREFVDETCDVVGYGMRGASGNVRGIGGGVTKMAGGVAHMIGSTFEFVASLFR